ncbi:MAG TPA: alpha/beta hydrolase-fold protein [Verrucomicrobiaceae bacterium]
MKRILLPLLLALACPPIQAQKVNDKDPNAPYVLGPDSLPKVGVPHGKVIALEPWKSKIYDGTVRDWWIYVPAQYDGSKPAALMVFQDGGKAKPEDKNFAGPNNAVFVFDNLIQAKQMPVTIGVFISPGKFLADKPGEKPRNRSFEYDTPDGTYARFLLEEILPEVEKKYQLSHKPEERAIVGGSSGGICAFKVAWERPDQFQKVVSHIGSFTNIRGGYIYPAAIRKTQPGLAPRAGEPGPTPEQTRLTELRRKIRVFLQDGRNDLDNQFGNWPLANQDMAAALKFAGWDYKFVLGEGSHSGKHGASIFPDTMRWLWRDVK